MKKSENLVFFGNERLSSGFSPQGAPTLQALLDAGYLVSAVVVNQQRPTSRKARPLEIEEVAKRHAIPVLAPSKLTDIKDQLIGMRASAGVLVAYGRIIPQSVIDIFPKGILNIHPSLLPQYRGSTPIEQAILDGATQTGVSVMGLVKAMDAGPIFAQQSIKLTGKEAKHELTQRLLQLGGQLLIDVLPSVLDGSAKPQLQNESKATFTPQISKDNALLNTNLPADYLARQVRAYAGWPKSRLTLLEQPIIVLESRVITDETDGALTVACNPGILEIQKLIAPSGRAMSGADFLRGYGGHSNPSKLG